MLGGGDAEPRRQNGIFIARSLDHGKTWSAMERVNTGIAREGSATAQVPSELMVRGQRCTLFFSSHDGLFGGWKSWIVRSDDSCRTWSQPEPVPGRFRQQNELWFQVSIAWDAANDFWQEMTDGLKQPRLTCTEALFDVSFPFPVRKTDRVVKNGNMSHLIEVAEAQAEVAFIECGVHQ